VEQFPDAERKDNDEMKLNLMDLKVKNYLFQANDLTVLDTILKQGTAKEITDRSHLIALQIKDNMKVTR
jgi:hypothetical protein